LTNEVLEKRDHEIDEIKKQLNSSQIALSEKNKIADQIKIELEQIKNELQAKEEEFKQEKQRTKKLSQKFQEMQAKMQLADKERTAISIQKMDSNLEKRQKDLDEITESIELKSMELDNITTKLNIGKSALERIENELNSSNDEEMTRMRKEKSVLYDEIDKILSHDGVPLKTKKLDDELE
jgi:chromosome segregation ATPase